MTEHSDAHTATRGILAGVRIIELSSFVAAPLGGMTLAQLGADVIRIDPIGGAADVGRWPLAEDGTSLYWTGLNKGKRSVTVDFKSKAGQDLVTRLIADSGPSGGIVLTNASCRGWLAHHELRKVRPDLIQVQIQGHYDGSSAVDYTVNAQMGFPMITGPEAHSSPVNHVLPAWDIACGLYASIGILSAELRRRTTGLGELVQIALYDVALAAAGNLGLLAEAQVNGVRRQSIGNYLYGAFGCDFTTKDEQRVMVVTLTTRHWNELMAATGLSEQMAAISGVLQADFTSDGDRFRFREVIAALLRPWFEDHTIGEIGQILGATSVLWSPYQSFHDLVTTRSSELRANPMISEINQAGVGAVLAPGSPLRFDTAGRTPVRPAPALGAHTGEVLADLLGLSAEKLDDLRRDQVVDART
jgi:2-methylfumaryl-CoA isomerase